MRYVEVKEDAPVTQEELISACMLAYWALTDGIMDVPPGKRDSKCAYIRVLAKRKLRRILDRLGKEVEE